MDIREVATWLTNIDGNGASDEDFAECMVMMYKMFLTSDTNINVTAKDMLAFDVEAFTKWIKDCLVEIIWSDEMCTSCWWKQEK